MPLVSSTRCKSLISQVPDVRHWRSMKYQPKKHLNGKYVCNFQHPATCYCSRNKTAKAVDDLGEFYWVGCKIPNYCPPLLLFIRPSVVIVITDWFDVVWCFPLLSVAPTFREFAKHVRGFVMHCTYVNKCVGLHLIVHVHVRVLVHVTTSMPTVVYRWRRVGLLLFLFLSFSRSAAVEFLKVTRSEKKRPTQRSVRKFSAQIMISNRDR